MLLDFLAKSKQDTREIQIHPKLRGHLEAYQPDIKKNIYLLVGMGEDVFTPALTKFFEMPVSV